MNLYFHPSFVLEEFTSHSLNKLESTCLNCQNSWAISHDQLWLHYRTMQTAVGVFGGEAYTDGVSVPPLMVANTGNSDHPAISSLNCPPFLTVELCREHLVCHGASNRYCRAFFMHLCMKSYCIRIIFLNT